MQRSDGYKSLHSDVTLNYTLNRLMTDVSETLLRDVAARVGTLEEWIEEAMCTADTLEEEGRGRESAFLSRGAEFFMPSTHARKREAYERFMRLFAEGNPEVGALRTSVAFEGGELAIIDIPAKGPERDVILACNGFDGLIEEMYRNMLYLAEHGYRVVLYEGAGQGAALRRHGLVMSHEWEKSVKAVLDALAIDECTLLGLSLGGYLAPRAAAFEPRAKRVISWGQMYDFFDCFRGRAGDEGFQALTSLLDAGDRQTINDIAYTAMRQNSGARWALEHGMHTGGAADPFDYYCWARDFHLRDLSSDISQDCLIMAGSEDHLVPLEQIWSQGAALVNAKSVTLRVFTKEEQAAEHCQSTNPKPALDQIVAWLRGVEERDRELNAAGL